MKNGMKWVLSAFCIGGLAHMGWASGSAKVAPPAVSAPAAEAAETAKASKEKEDWDEKIRKLEDKRRENQAKEFREDVEEISKSENPKAKAAPDSSGKEPKWHYSAEGERIWDAH